VPADSSEETPVPMVVKLSQAFYNRFGDEVVDELVGMLNQVDVASQQSLRELNEANFARFSDRLEQRFSALEALMERRLGEQTRWLYVSWATNVAASVALWFRHRWRKGDERLRTAAPFSPSPPARSTPPRHAFSGNACP
jgi:hypothetical protein